MVALLFEKTVRSTFLLRLKYVKRQTGVSAQSLCQRKFGGSLVEVMFYSECQTIYAGNTPKSPTKQKKKRTDLNGTKKMLLELFLASWHIRFVCVRCMFALHVFFVDNSGTAPTQPKQYCADS